MTPLQLGQIQSLSALTYVHADPLVITLLAFAGFSR